MMKNSFSYFKRLVQKLLREKENQAVHVPFKKKLATVSVGTAAT